MELLGYLLALIVLLAVTMIVVNVGRVVIDAVRLVAGGVASLRGLGEEERDFRGELRDWERVA
jgi:hypothetical protein